MSGLYPMLLRPEFHERVWGARSLTPFYAHEIRGGPIGEVWLTGENCSVSNGPLAGRALGDLCRQFGADLLGGPVAARHRFPLLIKFLFPHDKLSVQVHPDDEIAARLGEPSGKTECWYILQAEPGAQVGLGLKPGTTKAEVERAIAMARMEQLLNWIEVSAGDMIYVEAGTVHAIGPGVVIVETQQNSDTTYRLYDYGRPRELHIERGLQATKEKTRAGKVIKAAPQSSKGKTQVSLVASPYFMVDRFKLTQPWEFRRPGHTQRAAWCLIGIGGCGVVQALGSEPVIFNCGEAVVVPAAIGQLTLQPQWELEFLCASLPVEGTVPPETVSP
ncbi:MAG TPA: type I phosphomannose isomerase catalytic subunit [Candidatus Saccharimonadales bacterium]|nr:type I phosphomannose isomerase catalytic subunit [Candidatus Saccharimonadales bacterium]